MTNRYKLAQAMLGLPDVAETKSAIKAMSPERRDHLRALVDWVEDYERHENPKLQPKVA